MTNPIQALTDEIIRVIRLDPQLDEAIPQTKGWISYGLPNQNGPWPCVRLDRFMELDDKLGRHSIMVKLWSNDTTATFLSIVRAFKTALESSHQFQTAGYSPAPEDGKACYMFPVTFIP